MTDGFKQFQTDGPEEFSDERLRAYLLGEMIEPERLLLDQRLLADDDLAERVRLVEAQLIDEHVAGELDARTAGVFHTQFLKTDARREQVRLTAALRDFAGRSSAGVSLSQQPEKRTWREVIGPFLVIRTRPAWATAGSFALLLLVLGVIAYLGPKLPRSEPPVAQQSSTPESVPSPASTPQVAQVATPAAPTPQVKPSPSEPPVAVASFVLLPGALRGSGETTRVAVPRGERAIVRLSLVLENPAPGAYRVELANADGQTVTVKKDLRPHRNGQTKIIVEVPARLLHPDDYQIKLTRHTDGKDESVGRYYFRALPE